MPYDDTWQVKSYMRQYPAPPPFNVPALLLEGCLRACAHAALLKPSVPRRDDTEGAPDASSPGRRGSSEAGSDKRLVGSSNSSAKSLSSSKATLTGAHRSLVSLHFGTKFFRGWDTDELMREMTSLQV